MRHTILRQWLILSMLPRPPRRIDTGAIEARLRERGFEVHRRTIQRDLLDLAAIFPLVADERAKPYGWRWADHADAMPVPSPTPTALSLRVVLRIRRERLAASLATLAARDVVVVEESSNAEFAVVTTTLDDTGATRQHVLWQAKEVAVVSPTSLRDEIVEVAERVLATYASPARTGAPPSGSENET